MKKIKLTLVSLLIIAASLAAFAACSKDNSNKEKPSCWKLTLHYTAGGQSYTQEAGYWWGTDSDWKKYVDETLAGIYGNDAYYTREKVDNGYCNQTY